MSHLTRSLRTLAHQHHRALLVKPASATLVVRALSTSPVLRLATPQTGPTHPGYPTPPPAPVVPKATTQVTDYSQGPSALDKASSLFFFTEILRGASPSCSHLSPRLSFVCVVSKSADSVVRFACAGWSIRHDGRARAGTLPC